MKSQLHYTNIIYLTSHHLLALYIICILMIIGQVNLIGIVNGIQQQFY